MFSASLSNFLGRVLTGMFGIFALASCETTIPSSDTTPPRVELRISGPGGGGVMSNPPRAEWRTGPDGLPFLSLRMGAEYNFALTVSDSGGVSDARLTLTGLIEILALDQYRDGIEFTRSGADGIVRNLRLRGSASDPRTGLVISGRFRTDDPVYADLEEVAPLRFRASGSDFGGTSGRGNVTQLVVEAQVLSAGLPLP